MPSASHRQTAGGTRCELGPPGPAADGQRQSGKMTGFAAERRQFTEILNLLPEKMTDRIFRGEALLDMYIIHRLKYPIDIGVMAHSGGK